MSEQAPSDPMEERLRDLAESFPYPPTPNLAASVRQRLAEEGAFASKRERASSMRPRMRAGMVWAPIALALLLLFAASLTVPEVQAFVREVLRIGGIRIVTETPTAGTPTPFPTPVPGLDLTGETTLEQARRRISFPIRLPGYPGDLGQPDRVFVQDVQGDAVVFAWLDKTTPDRARLLLDEMSSNVMAEKTLNEGTVVERTMVNGQQAAWVQGTHILQYYNKRGSQSDMRRLINENVLIWEEGGVTYRLQADMTLREAIKVAESLALLPGEPPMPYATPAVLNLSGETSLEQAQQEIGARFKLPRYPSDLGPPDRVFLQYKSLGPVAALAWMEPGQDGKVRMMLYRTPDDRGGVKGTDPGVVETTVNGRPALWAKGPSKVALIGRNGSSMINAANMMGSYVLIWTEQNVTYQLESNLTMEEAVRVVESRE